MKTIELDITTPTGKYNQKMEVANDTTLTQLATMARQLAVKCGWSRVRVGIGNMWSTELLTERRGR